MSLEPSVWVGPPSALGRWAGDPEEVAHFLATRLTEKDIPAGRIDDTGDQLAADIYREQAVEMQEYQDQRDREEPY